VGRAQDPRSRAGGGSGGAAGRLAALATASGPLRLPAEQAGRPGPHRTGLRLLVRLAASITRLQAISRRQFLEYKLKLASRMDGSSSTSSSSGLSAADRAAFITELTEIQASLDASTKHYEKKYGESYFKTTSLEPAAGNSSVASTPSQPRMTSLQPPPSVDHLSLPAAASQQQGGVKGLSSPAGHGSRPTPRK